VPRLPAKCTRCGHVFPSAIKMGDAARNNSVTNCRQNCPRCGGVAQVADGTFSVSGGALVLDHGPASSRAMMERLYGVARRAKEEDLTAREIIAEVAEINPGLAKKLEKKGLPAFVLLIFLFLFVRHFDVHVDVDLNKLIDQAYHIAQGQDPEQHLEQLAKEPDATSSAAATQPAKESRQVRRHRERQSKKHAPPPKP
jgi:hypothetical protein